MIFPEYYNIEGEIGERSTLNSGLILVDILLALSLGVLFIVLITQSSLSSRDLFEFAKERSRLLDLYEVHANEFENMMPYESRSLILPAVDWKSATTTIRAYAKWYGNDRIQTDITLSTNNSASSTNSSSSTPHIKYDQSITFNNVRAYPFANSNDPAGTPLCSVDFSNKNVVGSYGFMQPAMRPNPQMLSPHITPIALPIDPLLPLTDIQVRNGLAYVATDSTKSADPDILIFDIRDPAHVNLTAGLNTGPGIDSIALAGNRIFAAVTSRTAQLQAIRMPTKDSMVIESSYKLPLPYATATPALGSAIFYNNNRVYLGTEKWDGEEFSIIDVSNLAQPMKIGGLETNSKVGAIFVRNNFAYVTASDEKQLRIIDVSNPASPTVLNLFGPSGWERQEGKVISFFEDSLQWGRTSGGFNIKNDYELFSWSTSSIIWLQQFNTSNPYSVDISGGVYGMITDRSFVYNATRQSGKEIQIFDHTLSTTTMKTVPLPIAPQTMTCDQDYIYVLGSTAPIIYQISFK